MENKAKMKNIMVGGLACLLAACNESFPALYAPEGDNGYNSTEVTKDGKVPILLSLTDPDYEILVPTRGSGVFDTWNNDREHWRKAEFHTFAYFSPNFFSKHASPRPEADYRNKEADGMYCLLYDDIMTLSDNGGGLRFKDGKTRYYSMAHQNYKYKFFTFYADDAYNKGNIQPDQKRVTMPVRIDGTQDILHGFAYHTEQELDKELDKIPSGDSESKVMTQHRQEMLYSTIAGHRGINPIFRIKHLLTRLNLKVRGGTSHEISESYKSMIVTGISISSPTEGTLVIANDNWTESTYLNDWKNNQILIFDPKSNKDLKCKVKTEGHRHPECEDIPGFHISTDELQVVSEPLLVAPTSSYHLTIYTKRWEDDRTVSTPPAIHYDLVLSDGQGGSKPFEAGKEYTIHIYVYGEQDIKVAVADLPSWDKGDDIPVGEEK